MRKRVWVGGVGLVVGAVVLGASWALRVAERPHVVPVPVPVGGRLDRDQTPFGEAAYHAERLTAEFAADLAPGPYAVAPGVVLDVPPDDNRNNPPSRTWIADAELPGADLSQFTSAAAHHN